MYEGFGAVVDGGRVTFQLFLPDNAKDPSQYLRGGSPQIVSVSAPGSYQAQLGGTAWDMATAPGLEATDHQSGTLYVSETFELPDGFYEYKYYVTFANGARRWCTDPCTRYVGLTDQNSGFVIGGSRVEPAPNVAPRDFPDLVIYELMLDDFTAAYRADRPPVDAVLDKLDYLVELGINTIEFMPWTAWRGDDFDWGYDPYLFFSVENRYIEDPGNPLDRLVRLQRLIDTLHKRGIGVIMDGVFDHVNAGQVPDTGFGYFWLYQNPADSPYIGSYAGGGYFQDLDYHSGCTQQFITDVCTYWLDRYQLDGIRFDYVGGIYIPDDRGHGVAKLIPDLRSHLEAQGRDKVALILEDMPDNRYDAINDTNQVDATGCWYDRMHWDVPAAAQAEAVTPAFVRVCNSALDFEAGKGPVTYLENHDHSSVVSRVGGRDYWWRIQPAAIAQFTCAGAVMLHNGQEFGGDYLLPEDGVRVIPRPLQWQYVTGPIGQELLALYRRLIKLRAEHPALRSSNFYPWPYAEQDDAFNGQGYGVNVAAGVTIHHRWGQREDGTVERIIVVLNFSATDRSVDVPFSINGDWIELLTTKTATVTSYRMTGVVVPSHWGRIYAIG